jgi:pimeloyl-ACP methyl ester carboxylesterase
MTSEITHRTVRTNGIDMHVAEAGPEDGELVVLCHGFPELWYSWRHQIPALAGAGYRVLAPDQRGYGRTSRPEAIEDYDILHLTDDLLGLLDDVGREDAVFVGHDWGAMVVWGMAQLHPERVRGVVGMSVPFTPRRDRSLIEVLRAVMGDTFFYILYFQEPGVADADLGKDPREAMRRFLCAIGARHDGEGDSGFARALPAATTTFWDWMPPAPTLPPWLTEHDLDVFASEFERTGFTGGINWYRNFHRNWELTPQLLGKGIDRPALFIAGVEDPVIRMTDPGAMADVMPDLRGTVLLDGAGHWVQQEKPDEVNETVLSFLNQLA